MKFLDKIKSLNYNRIGTHVIFWIVITLGYDAISSLLFHGKFAATLITDLLFYTPTDMIGVYFTLYILFPVFLYKKRYIGLGISFLVFFFILLFGIAMPLQYYGIKEILHHNMKAENFAEFVRYTSLQSITIKLMIIGIASSIKISKFWFSTQIKQQILVKEKLETELKLKESELKFLKSQINPHFLFNSLNNLYSLTLQKSDKAPEVVLKISALLDYILYECNVSFIYLDKEIESVKNYIELQKIRYGKNSDITFEINGETKDAKIAPLLILPLIENAFKHGLDKNIGKGFININISVDTEDTLNLLVENSLNGENNHEGEGIGIINLKKRLELQYPNNHEFEIIETPEKFVSKLKVNLEQIS
jgi:sensor histidine kinase YesM